MKRLRAWVSRCGGVFRRGRAYREFAEELQSNLQLHIDDNVRYGMSPEEARRAASLRLGGMAQVQEARAERQGIPAVETLARDLRYGARMLAKSPGVTAILIVTLALGIGANTAIFSVLNGWLLRPMPVRSPEQIVVLAAYGKEGIAKFSYPALEDLRKQSDAFSDVFAYAPGLGGLSANGHANEFAYFDVTGNYFSALGVKPALGRFFRPGESELPGEKITVVLGHAYWLKKFGADPGVVGRQVLLDGKPVTIAGVAPPQFHGPLFGFDVDGYLPLSAMSPEHLSFGDSIGFRTDRRKRIFELSARLKPGVSMARARSSANLVASRLAEEYPAADKDTAIRVIPERMARPAPFVASYVPAIASLFLGLAAMVLVLACLNVGNILLARATARGREMAIRAALGAARGRLIRQMLTESLLLALLGALLGVLLGQWALSASGAVLRSVTTNSADYAFRLDVGFDWRVLGYALGSAFVTALLAGVWPAFRAGRTGVNTGMREGGRGGSAGARSTGIRGALVMAQVAGSVTLLIAAGLFVRSLDSARHMNLGFDPDRVLNVMMDPREIGYDEARTKAFYGELERRVRALPGVRSVSLAHSVPFAMPGDPAKVHVEGRAPAPGHEPPGASYNTVDSHYFETMRVPLVQGRAFGDFDTEKSPRVAIVNQAMARRFWPDENPIGKRFSITDSAGPLIEIAGVARDGQYFFLSPQAQPYFYVPLAQNPGSFLSLQVRSSVPPESLITPVRAAIGKLAPDLPVFDIRPMDQVVNGLGGLFVFRLAASLAASMGVLGLTLAVVGVYGVVSFAVTQRTQEIGIRMALGAGRRDILKMISRQGFTMVAVGVAAGLLAALGITRAMGKLLIGVSPSDPATYVTVAVLLFGVTMVACWIPARRAARVDPLIALRYE